MKISVRSNIFEVTAASTLEAYASHVEGTPSATALVVSEQPLSAAARDALGKSLSTLGWVGPANASSAAASTAASPAHAAPAPKGLAFAVLAAEGMRLGAADAFSIIEGLDPLCLVITDAASAQLLSQAYRRPIDLDAPLRLLGRPSAAFANFEDMLADSEQKQRAWAVLKRIPKSF